MNGPLQTVKEKIGLRIVVPVLCISAGFALLAFAAAVIVRQPKAVAEPPIAVAGIETTTDRQHRPSRDAQVGKVLVKIKPGTDIQTIAKRVLRAPQQYVQDRRTGALSTASNVVTSIQPQDRLSRTVVLQLRGVESLSHPVSTVVKKKISQRIGANDPDAADSQSGLNQWSVVAVNETANVFDLAERFAADPDVAAAQPDYIYRHPFSAVPQAVPVGDTGTEPAIAETTVGVMANDYYFTSSGNFSVCSAPGVCGPNIFGDQWGLQRIHIGDAWTATTGNAAQPVVVAVIDSGVDMTHPELQGRIWTNPGETAGNGVDDDGNGYVDDVHGWDVWHNTNDPSDNLGHGTFLAGIIGAATNNVTGMAGINWSVQIMPVRIGGKVGSGANWSEDIINSSGQVKALKYARDNGADVINLSYGWSGSLDPILQDGINSIHDSGVILIGAAGNNGQDLATNPFYPASFTGVLSVGAWCPNNTTLYRPAPLGTYCTAHPKGSWPTFSNYGLLTGNLALHGLDIVAPGVDTLSLRAAGTDMYDDGKHIVNGQYYFADGTSFSAPHTSGVAALLRAIKPGLAGDLASLILKQSAEDITDADIPGQGYAAGPDAKSGNGVLDAAKAVTTLQNFLANPKPELTLVNGSVQVMNQTQGNLQVTVKNIGFSTASTVSYAVYAKANLMGAPVKTGTISNIVAGGTSVISWTYVLAAVMTDNFSVSVASAPAEYLDTNNSMNITLKKVLAGWPQAGGQGGALPLAVDLTGDGQPEVLAPSGTSVMAWSGDGSTVTGWPVTVGGASTIVAVAAADIDGDGRSEIIAVTNDGHVYVWRNDGTPFGAAWPAATGGAQAFYPPAIGDLNGDGKQEIVLSGSNGHAYAWDYQGHLLVGWGAANSQTSGSLRSPVLADLEGNGKLEAIFVSGRTVYVLRPNGTRFDAMSGTPTQWPVTVTTPSDLTGPPAVADLNHDGKPEIIAGDGGGELHVWNNTGTAYPTPFPPLGVPMATSPVIADFAHDGNLEIIIGGNDGSFYGWRAATGVQNILLASSGISSGNTPAVADVDGDGQLELVTAGLTPAAIRLNGMAAMKYQTGSVADTFQSTSPVVVDIDGDGRPEILVAKQDGNIYAFLTPGSASQDACPWLTGFHDARHSGTYGINGTGDIAPPAVSISSPADQTFVRGTTTMATDAVDDIGVTTVSLWEQSNPGRMLGSQKLATITQSPFQYTLNTATLPDGQHIFTAKASDGACHTTTSLPITITVDNTPPLSTISHPGSGATVSGTVTISGSVSDAQGIASAAAYLDGTTLIGRSSMVGRGTAIPPELLGKLLPYDITWQTTSVKDGAHLLTVVATDNAGNTKTSATTNIVVSNAAGGGGGGRGLKLLVP